MEVLSDDAKITTDEVDDAAVVDVVADLDVVEATSSSSGSANCFDAAPPRKSLGAIGTIRNTSGNPSDCGCGATRVTVAQTRSGRYRMAVLHPDWVSHYIRSRGHWEITDPGGLTRLANRTAPERGIFLDIGANIGYHSSLFAFYNYTVISIEPRDANRRAFEATLCMNPKRMKARTTLIPTALGPTRGHCLLSSFPGNVGNGALDCSTDECPPGYLCETVPLRRLDDVLDEQFPPSSRWWRSLPMVVKMDTEGTECSILASGQSLFTRLRPRFIQIEGKDAATARCIRVEAQRHGYQIGHKMGWDNNTVLFVD